MKTGIVVALVYCALLIGGCATQGSTSVRGTELRLRYAQITGVERVPLPSAAPGGAVVGGFTGLVLSRNRSVGTRVAAGAGGAALGALATRALEGDRQGYSYSLRYTDGSISRFITEKGYLQLDDCVVVESGQYANVRRVAATLCDGTASAAVEPELLRDAEQCHAAKDELLAATSSEAIDVAARKVEILCQY